MSIDWNQVAKDAESQLVQTLTTRVLSGLIAQVPWLGAISGPVGWLISMGVAVFVKYGDLLAYMAVDGWKNSSEGKAFENAALKNRSIPKDSPYKAAAEKAQRDAFDALMGAGSN